MELHRNMRSVYLFAIVVCLLFTLSFTAQAQKLEVSSAVRQAVSEPLRDMPIVKDMRPVHSEPVLRIPLPPMSSTASDDALQLAPGSPLAVTTGLSFAGVGNGDYGFAPNAAPPDTNGAVGTTQYVQWVNESFAVFNKSTGALVAGPTAGNSIFKNLGGACASNNDGDPIAKFDQIAQRWVLTQFSVATTPYLQCVAVSQTADATGAYYLYAFSYGTTQFPDYPKLSVWPDGYYITFNIFNNGSTFGGAKLCAYNRSAMLTGAAATQQCFQLSTSYGGVLPSDLDGTTLPPAGAPNVMVNFGTSSLNFWKFHVDWTTPANTTLTGPTKLTVASFTAACGGGTCVPQSGTKQQLDSLADRLMYRLAYRNMSSYESWVVNHSVSTGSRSSGSGIRWYELRTVNGNPAVYQQGTFAPDSTYRWMGSIAMDKVGNIAVGYSASSSSIYPSIRITGRVPTDTLGTMEAEQNLLTGGGSQGRTLSRWGDYSAMSVDPVDGCTFWFTTEYLKANGTFNWSTKIFSFKFPTCQ